MLHRRVWQLVSVVPLPREVPGEQFARAFDRLHDRIGKLLLLKMHPHRLNQLLPEFRAAPLVHALVADNRELLRTWRDEDQDRVPLGRLVHPELDEFLLREGERIALHVRAVDEDADLSRRFRLRRGDRRNDSLMVQPVEEILWSHRPITSSILHRRRRSCRRRH